MHNSVTAFIIFQVLLSFLIVVMLFFVSLGLFFFEQLLLRVE